MNFSMNYRARFSAVALLLVLASGAPAAAQTAPADNPNAFKLCDGFGAPNENGDGMTKMASGFLGLFRMASHAGDTSKSSPTFSKGGVDACNDALAQQRLAPQYHLRRASLIRARGLHQFGLDQYQDGMKDLDASDVEGRLAKAPYYERSVGVGNKLFRAYALQKMDNKQPALALLREVRQERPYTFQTQLSTNALEYQMTNDWPGFLSHLEQMATVHPKARLLLFYAAMDSGAFDKAVAIHPTIDLALPPEKNGGFRIANYENLRAEQFADRISIDTANALALAGINRKDDALALLAKLEERIMVAAGPLPLKADGRKQPKLERDSHAATQKRLPELTAKISQVRQAIALLDVSKKGDLIELHRAMAGSAAPPTGAWVPLILRTLKANATTNHAEIDSVLATIEKRLGEAKKIPAITQQELYNIIPGAETPERLPKFKGAKNIIGENTGNGFVVRKDGEVTEVGFGGVSATASTVEEMALLKAAEDAKALGHTHIATLTSNISQRTLHTHGPYFGSVTSPMGYNVELRYISVRAFGTIAELCGLCHAGAECRHRHQRFGADL